MKTKTVKVWYCMVFAQTCQKVFGDSNIKGNDLSFGLSFVSYLLLSHFLHVNGTQLLFAYKVKKKTREKEAQCKTSR